MQSTEDPAPPGSGATIAQPVQESERIATLDVLRGFAILGIFIPNIFFFAMPLTASIDSSTLPDEGLASTIAWAFMKIFAEFKFVSLFSLLFGVGMIVQMNRARARGAAFGRIYLRRLVLLAGLGLFHALFIWYGDILFAYAVIGFVVFSLRGLPARTLLFCGLGSLILSLILAAGCLGLGAVASGMEMEQRAVQVEEDHEDARAQDPSSAGAEDDRWDRFIDALSSATGQPGDPNLAEAERVAYGEGPFVAALLIRSVTWLFIITFSVLSGFTFRIFGMFLLGAALMKFGFFTEQFASTHRKLLLIALPLGLLLEFTAFGLAAATGFQNAMVVTGSEVLHQFASIFVCFGYLGAIAVIVRAGVLGWLQRGLAAVGRTALSNYLAQSVVVTGIMYWWGFGLFDHFSRAELLGLVAIVFCVQVSLSVLWLRFFRFGPVEWLWRSLTYLRPQPLLRSGPETGGID